MPTGKYLRPTATDRFWAKIIPEPNSGCWLWDGSYDNYGYGQIWADRRVHRAHRFSYTLNVGPITPGLCICHRCDTPACVNPDHLFVGTQADNIRDAVRKGRVRGGGQSCEAHHSAKLSFAKVRQMKALRSRGLIYREIAARFGVSKATAMKAIKGQNWNPKEEVR